MTVVFIGRPKNPFILRGGTKRRLDGVRLMAVRGGEALGLLQLAERLVDQTFGIFLVAAVEIGCGAEIAQRTLQVPFGTVYFGMAPLGKGPGGERNHANGEHDGSELEMATGHPALPPIIG